MSQWEDYELARSLIDYEYDSACDDFKGTMDSMGWASLPEHVVQCAEKKLRDDGWCRKDVDDLAVIVRRLRKTSGNAALQYNDDVADFTSNLIAGYMTTAIAACFWKWDDDV